MKSKSGSTNVLSCGLALPVLAAMGSPLPSIMIMIFTPLPALVHPMPSPPPLALEKGAIDMAFVELEAAAFFDDGSNGCQQRFESSHFHPPCEAAMNCTFAAKLRRKVLPFRPIIKDPKDASNRLAPVGRRPAAVGTNRMNR